MVDIMRVRVSFSMSIVLAVHISNALHFNQLFLLMFAVAKNTTLPSLTCPQRLVLVPTSFVTLT